MSRRRGVDPVFLLQVAAGALIGGALAVAALARLRHITHPGWVAGFVLLAVAISVFAAATLPRPTPQTRPAPRPDPTWQRDDAGSGHPPTRRPGIPDQEPASGWSWASMRPNDGVGGHRAPSTAAPAAPVPRDTRPRSDPGPAPVSAAIPVRGGAWWRPATAGARTRHPQAAAPAQDPPVTSLADLPDYSSTTRVVQCPRCGDFRVDVGQREPGFAFTCKRCGHHWRWEPGSAWPTTVVRPRVSRRSGPGGGAELT